MQNTALNQFKMKPCIVSLPETVGRGYGAIWRDKHRYLIVKGSRGSKKSTTIALRIIYNMMKYPLSNTLVMRRFFNTHLNSTWAQLKRAAKMLKVEDKWKFSKNPMEAVYLPTGQKIIFRGFDNPDSVTSITVDEGYLCWVWIEEAYQIESEENFNKLDMSIRGMFPDDAGIWKQIVFTFNPWSSKTWIKKRFWDAPDEDTACYTTTWECNEFLDDSDRRQFIKIRDTNPNRYRVEGLGDWGISEGLIYSYKIQDFDITQIAGERTELGDPKYTPYYGLDFGWEHPTALICCYASRMTKKIYIYDEHYQRMMKNEAIARMIKQKGLEGCTIRADSARPEIIQTLRDLGCYNIRATKKGPDSVLAGIRKLQDYEIIVHPSCVNTIKEFDMYCWMKDPEGKVTDKPIKEDDHLMDALRYATESLGRITFDYI